MILAVAAHIHVVQHDSDHPTTHIFNVLLHSEQHVTREFAVLHDNDGWVDFDVAGGSYYYSPTRMPTCGTLTVDGYVLALQGTSWFAHIGRDFIAVRGCRTVWFAIAP